MSISPFLEGASFDPETVALLISALDAAWDTVRKSGAPTASDGQAASTRERLAKKIIALARDGERNRSRLIEGALAGLADSK